MTFMLNDTINCYDVQFGFLSLQNSGTTSRKSSLDLPLDAMIILNVRILLIYEDNSKRMRMCLKVLSCAVKGSSRYFGNDQLQGVSIWIDRVRMS